MDLFGAKAKIAPEHLERIRAAVRKRFALVEDVSIRVIELRCSEEGCPPLETVIAILEPGDNRQYKIHKAAADVNEEDVARL